MLSIPVRSFNFFLPITLNLTVFVQVKQVCQEGLKRRPGGLENGLAAGEESQDEPPSNILHVSFSIYYFPPFGPCRVYRLYS
jgi:hypothetical protein